MKIVLPADFSRIASSLVFSAVVLLPAACQKAEHVPTTAERLKNVEVRQQTEPDSYVPRKSVDYLANMKDLKDAPDRNAAKTEAKRAESANPAAGVASNVPPASAPVASAVALPAPAPKTAERAPESRPAAPSPAPPPAVVASVPAPADPPRKSDAPKADAGAASQSAYFASLRNYLANIKRYPTSREARQQRPSGTVQLWLEIGRDGKFRDAGIEQSSTSSILDQAALSTVRQGNYPAFPADAWPGQPSRRFTLSLEYAIDSNG
jgi:protein TonB